MTENVKKRGPGRPRKVRDDESTAVASVFDQQEVVIQELPPVRHVQRNISKFGLTVSPEDGVEQYSAADVESTLDGYYKSGYKLLETHFLGLEPDTYNMMYILVLE
jgi:hypothetical protein